MTTTDQRRLAARCMVGGRRRRIDNNSLHGIPASMSKRGANPWGQLNWKMVGCVVWLSSSRFDNNDQDKDHPPSIGGMMHPGVMGGSARGEAGCL
jgi:hypothetical protein